MCVLVSIEFDSSVKSILSLPASVESHPFFESYEDHQHHHEHHGNHDDDDDDDGDGDGQVSLSYLPEHAGILLSVLTYAPIRIPDNLFRPTVTLLSYSCKHTFTLF